MRLEDITEKDYNDIFKLTSNKKIMQYAGNGKPWYEKKVLKFIKYNEEERELESKYRTQFYYKMTIDDKFIGIIGFHIQGTSKYVLAVYMLKKEQGKGHFSQALELLKRKIRSNKPKVDKLYSQVYPENEKMNAIMAAKYYYNGEFKLGRTVLNEYIIPVDKYTYLVKTEYVKISDLEKELAKRGIWQKFDPTKHKNPDFIYVDGKYEFDKSLYKYRSLLKNTFNNSRFRLTSKYRLSNLGELNRELDKKFGIQSYIFSNFERIDRFKSLFDGRKWIVKNAAGWAGRDIAVFSTFKDFEEFVNKYRKGEYKKKYNKQEFNVWVIQEYVENLLLFKEKKFHMRVPFNIFENKVYLASDFLLYTAKKKYNGNIIDKDIYDSRFLRTGKSFSFWEDLDISEKKKISIMDQLVELMNIIKKFKFKCYEEDNRCFMLFGADIFITNDYKIKLIEINEKVARVASDNYWVEYTKATLTNIIDKVFPPINYIEDNDFLLEI